MMGIKLATFLPSSGHIVGTGSSFFIHVIGVFCVMYMSSVVSNTKPSLLIDFNIQKPPKETKVQGIVNKTSTAQNQVTPKVRTVVPPQEPAPTDKKPVNSNIYNIEHKQNIALAEITQLPPHRQPLLKKELVSTPRIIVRGLSKKKFTVTKKEPKQIYSKETPTHPVIKRATVNNIATEAKRSKNIFPDKVDSPVRSLDKSSDKTSNTRNNNLPVSQGVAKSPPPREQYLKEHFLYIKESVQNKITYPHIARKMGWQGKVLISFVICKDGSVKDIRIVKSSGFKALDKKAVEVIQKTAPFPKPPVSAELVIPITYKLG